MKQTLKALTLSTLALTGATILSSNAFAEATLSGNAGILSDYNYRGIPQDSGVGNGGLDLEVGGFYLGTWIADVGTGVEYDVYGGYVHEFTNGMYLGGGYTTYQYSDNFDAEYNEANIYAGWSNDTWSVDLEFSPGEYNGEFSDGDNYDFYAATVGWNGAYVTYGMFDDDAEDELGNYLEVGYGFEVAGFDMTAAIVHTDDADILGDDGDETEAYVGIHRSFDIMSWGS
ncbi:MAG: TorF family putative porin [Gammaproteobacteria bacterium]